MAGKKDIAWVADQVNTTLKVYLAAKLDVLDTEYADGITLADVPSAHYFIAEQVKPIYPLIMTVPDTTDTGPFDGAQNYGLERHSLTVAVGLTANAGEDALKRRVIRTLRAIQEVLDEHPSLGSTVEHTFTLAKEYGPLFLGGGAIGQEAQLRIQVLTAD